MSRGGGGYTSRSSHNNTAVLGFTNPEVPLPPRFAYSEAWQRPSHLQCTSPPVHHLLIYNTSAHCYCCYADLNFKLRSLLLALLTAPSISLFHCCSAGNFFIFHVAAMLLQ